MCIEVSHDDVITEVEKKVKIGMKISERQEKRWLQML